MTTVRVFQLLILLALVLVGVWGNAIFAWMDIRRLQNQRKESYTAGIASIVNAWAVPSMAIGAGCLLLPWFLRSAFALVPREIPLVIDTVEIDVNFDRHIDRFAWIPNLIGWALIVAPVLYILFNLSKKIVVEKGSATFYAWFLPRQAVRIEDIATVKEHFRRSRAGVLPVYQCVYDVYVKGDGGQKKVYTLANTLGGVRFLQQCAAENKITWKNTTPKGYIRNPLIFPDLQPTKVPAGTRRQELYLLTIPCLLTRQMINNNLPQASGSET